MGGMRSCCTRQHKKIYRWLGSRKRGDQGGQSLRQQGSVCSEAVLHKVGNMA